MKTVNFLLDEINEIPLSEMTKEMGILRQNLINIKKQKGGQTLIKNSETILKAINQAKAINV